MRIVIDLQGAQCESRFRGIGRYSLSLAKEVARQAGSHEVWLALNGRFPGGITSLRRDFEGLIPAERIRVFDVPGPLAEQICGYSWRLQAAQLIREHFLASLRPDIVHVSSLFEGFNDDTVGSIGLAGLGTPTAVTLYDLIPLLKPETYLPAQPAREWYERKGRWAQRADLLLAISASSAAEARQVLGTAEDKIAVVGTGVDDHFRPALPDPVRDAQLRRRYGLDRPFILYTGAADPRKNLRGLLQAIALLPPSLRDGHMLACVGKLYNDEREELTRFAASIGIPTANLVLLGYVPDSDLIVLYSLCELFVFPSFHEGFGLPAAEAMICGAPVIGSNTTSVPEVIGRADALFDPAQPEAMARLMEQVLTSQGFRDELRRHGLQQGASFTWHAVADRTIEAFEAFHDRRQKSGRVALPAKRLRLALVHADPVGMQAVADLLDQSYDVASFDADRFKAEAGGFDRILYMLRNGSDATPLLPLLEAFPGLVLFTGGEPAVKRAPGERHALYDSHGLSAFMQEVAADLPCDEAIHRLAEGIIVYEREPIESAEFWYGNNAASRMRIVPKPDELGADATLWVEAIEGLSQPCRAFGKSFFRDLAALPLHPDKDDLLQAAKCVGANSPRIGQRQLFVDVSTLAITDARSGIQRVVRSILSALVAKPDQGWRIEPVRAEGEGYVYARAFSERFFDLPIGSLPDDAPMDVKSGDIFLGLDLAAHQIAPRRGWFEAQKIRGMLVHFVLYDLLPIRWPQMFPISLSAALWAWIDSVAELADGVACISQAVAQEFAVFNAPQCAATSTSGNARRSPQIGWFHLGADLQASLPSHGLPSDAAKVLETMSRRPFMLSVGTLEPRKGYAQTLAAFEQLWAEGVDIGLVIVGAPGWRTEELAERLRSHAEAGKRLLWLEGPSDEMLERVYKAAAGLLAASEAEGFGLPLIEAAQHGVPILARDLPVFREIASDHASYFTAFEPASLAAAIRDWLDVFRRDAAIGSAKMPVLTWQQSTQQLTDLLLRDRWQLPRDLNEAFQKPNA